MADRTAGRTDNDSGHDGASLGGPSRAVASLGRPSRAVASLGRGVVAIGGAIVALLAIWQAIVLVLAPPPYMLPSPAAVARAMVDNADRLATDTAVTLVEIAAGLLCGVVVGIAAGLAMAASPLVGRLLAPVLVVSQALPVFAIAPLLVLWFGFGLASKVVMAAIIIFFPVASALADGLRRTDPGLLDLAALSGAGRLRTLALIRLPAALPSLATGIRVGAVFAPIGAVIGEWVGASHGLGLMMIEANARMKTDLMFAALAILAVTVLVIRAVVDHLTRRMIPWVEDPG